MSTDLSLSPLKAIDKGTLLALRQGKKGPATLAQILVQCTVGKNFRIGPHTCTVAKGKNTPM